MAPPAHSVAIVCQWWGVHQAPVTSRVGSKCICPAFPACHLSSLPTCSAAVLPLEWWARPSALLVPRASRSPPRARTTTVAAPPAAARYLGARTPVRMRALGGPRSQGPPPAPRAILYPGTGGRPWTSRKRQPVPPRPPHALSQLEAPPSFGMLPNIRPNLAAKGPGLCEDAHARFSLVMRNS